MKKPVAKDRPVHRALIRQALRLSMPVVFSYLMVAIYINVDYAMVGQLGNDAMAAVGLSSWVYLILFLMFNAMEVGAQVMIARHVGEKDHVAIGRVFTTVLTLAAIIGVVCTIVVMFFAEYFVWASPEIRALGASFLRYRIAGFFFAMVMFAATGFFNGIGKPVIPMAAQVVGNLLNLFLNWLLIYGNWGFPAMGVRGAGLASTIGVTVSCLIMTAGLVRLKYRRKFDYGRRFFIDWAIIKRLFNIAYPIGLQAFFINGGFLAFIYINKSIGILAVSISQTIIYVTTISFLPLVGIGVAGATMVGQYLGAQSYARARRAGWICMVIGLATTIFFSLIYVIFGRVILGWYIDDAPDVTEEFLNQGIIVLRIIAVFQIFESCGVITARILQSAGFARFVMMVQVMLFWLLFLPAAYLYGVVWEHGVIGTWTAFVLYTTLYAAVMMIKYYRGKWVKGVI